MGGNGPATAAMDVAGEQTQAPRERSMLLAKAWYFCYFGATVMVWPYINLLYRQRGLGDAQIGVLAALKPWVSAPAAFVWAAAADRFSAHRAILLATFITSTIVRTCTAFGFRFWQFLVLAAVGEALASPVGVMADAAVVAASKRDTDYGRSRLWGAVAWGSLSAVSGPLVSHAGIGAGFVGYVLLSLPCVYCACRMNVTTSRPDSGRRTAQHEAPWQAQQQQQQAAEGLELQQQHQHQQHGQQHGQQQQQQHEQQQPTGAAGVGEVNPPPNFWAGLQQLLSTPAVLIFMWQACIMGFGIGVIGEFLFLFLSELGGSETLMGLTLTFTCMAEVPVFHYQGAILRHISVHTMLHVVLCTYALRLMLYALLPLSPSPWVVLPVELLHGITFGCGWGAGTINSKRVAPPGLGATMQGIFQGLYFGLGQGLGGLVGGLLKHRLGSQAMFLTCSGIVLLGWVVCIAAELVVARACSPSGRGGHGNRDQTQTHWRAKYSALASKDSGPDLAAGIATLREARAAVCGTASGSNTV